MKNKHILYGVLALSFIIGYNAWLIQRDRQLFEAYNQPTPKERFCKQQAQWHPDCNVE
jgi:hypothetical protein